MARASPAKINFNGGEVSDLIIQRTDLDRYPSFNRALRNYVAAPQGPAIGRSGTRFQHKAYKKDKKSAIIPFVFSDDQANILEFSELRMRVLSEDGALTTGFVSITNVVTTTPFKFTSSALVSAGAATGKQVAFTDFPDARNLEGVIANITGVSGNDITVDINYNGSTGAVSGPKGGLIYEVVTPYSHNDVGKIRYVQSLDVVYLFCKGYKQRKLSRTAETTWTLEEFDFVDGPYLDEVQGGYTLTPNDEGIGTNDHTSANTPAGGVVSASTGTGWHAFDQDESTRWSSTTSQTGTLTYVYDTAQVLDGYMFYVPKDNSGASNAEANRPATWRFEVSVDGSTNWTIVERKFDYALYKNYRTQYHKLSLGGVAYRGYRIVVENCEGDETTANGSNGSTVAPRITDVRFRKATPPQITFTLSNVAAINRGQGFLTTDVGRLIRVYQNDGFWRSVKIVSRTSSTVVVAELQGEPLMDTGPILRWRMGAFSDTTGWPTCGVLHDDRLCCGGAFDSPTGVALSQSQNHQNMAPTEVDGTLTAANAMFLRPATRNATPLAFLESTDKGLVLGFGSGIWVLGPNSPNVAFSATNAKATDATARGCADTQPVRVDNELLFVQANKRTLRQYAYAFEADNFKAMSVSLFASHFGHGLFEQVVYAGEPHSIAWLRKADGQLSGFTYNKDENVMGWHGHTFQNDIVESIAVIPGVSTHDELWAVVQRTINSQPERYIEKLMPFWDFGDTLDTAHFVDCGTRVLFGSPQTVVNNASHLEGMNVYGLADGKHFGFDSAVVVTNGQFTLPFAAENVVYGLQYERLGETANVEAGSQDGTAQGKAKRQHNLTMAVWDSYGGEIGIFNEDTFEYDFEAMTDTPLYRADNDLGDPQLFTGFIGPFNPPQGYGKRGAIVFRQTKPYPFNVLGLYPQLNVEDRG